MDTLTLSAVLTLTGVFGIAGIAKLADLAGTRTAVRAFGGPVALVPVIALLLPLAELVVAMLLLVPTTRVVGAVGALCLLALFSVVISANLARGRKPECHCFGQLHSAPTGWKTLVRNGLLGSIAAGLLVASRNDAGLSPWGWVAARSATELSVITGAIAAVILIVAIGASFLGLTRAYGRVLLRLEATEQALRMAGIEIASDADAGMSELGLDPGSPAPAFAMELSNAEPVTLDDLLAPRLPTLLVFTSPGCGPCHDLLPAVARWQHSLENRLTIAVASAGEPEALRRQEAEHGLAAMLVDTDLALSDAFLTTGTPSAVLIAPDGTIASYLAAGSEEIEGLVDSTLARSADTGLPVGAPAPDLALVGIDGELVPVIDPLGRDTVFLFWNPDCGYCREMLSGLLAWEREARTDASRLVVVSSGDADDAAGDGFSSPVVLDPTFAVGRAFRADGTPAAVLLDGQGRIGSRLAQGTDAVFALTGPSSVAFTRKGITR